jgi:hypothetical protein
MGWSPGPAVGVGGVGMVGLSPVFLEVLGEEKIFGIEAWALPSRKKTNVVESRTQASIRHTILVGVLRRILETATHSFPLIAVQNVPQQGTGISGNCLKCLRTLVSARHFTARSRSG